ncbi:MAG: amino acid ABC transporter permease [Methylobacteriaceae bacterium]|jgi:polar amino acid transport system permease protein|nr:amino acid ABC transporter permease [Methylobacteriaceae bacterium]
MSDGAAVTAAIAEDDSLRDVAHAYKPLPIVRGLVWLVIGLIALKVLVVLAQNRNFGWGIVGEWLTEASILRGLWVTLWLGVVSMALGVVLGLFLAIGRMSKDVLISSLASVYIWFFRGTPLLVQLIFWYNLSYLFPEIVIGIPFGPTLASWNTNDVISPLTAAIGGLALNEAAYMAEVIRGGLLSVDHGQIEATQAFGMSPFRALLRVILPQAMRAIVPPTGNQFISMMKSTSLVSVIAMADLLYSVQAVYNRTFEIIPMLLVAVFYYLVITSLLNVGQGFIERYYGRGERDAAGPAKAAQAPEG